MSKRSKRPSSLKKSEEVKDSQAADMDIFTNPAAQVNEGGINAPTGIDVESFLTSLPGGDGYGNHAGVDKITKHENGNLTYQGWHITPTALLPPDNITEDGYTEIGKLLLRLEGSLQWLLGDWLKEGENRQWGETYERVAGEFGYKVKTLQDYASVCRNVETSIRIEVLSFGHHQIIAKYSANPAIQEALLKGAAHEGWSIKQFRETIKTYAPVIDQSVNEGWSLEQFENAIANYNPDTEAHHPTSETPPLWQGASGAWDFIRGVGVTIERGKLPTPKQREEAKTKIEALRNYLAVLENQLNELER